MDKLIVVVIEAMRSDRIVLRVIKATSNARRLVDAFLDGILVMAAMTVPTAPTKRLDYAAAHDRHVPNRSSVARAACALEMYK